MFFQVVMDPLEELASASIGYKLAKHRRTFCICDAVKIHIRIIEVIDRGNDRVGCRLFIFSLPPAFFTRAECCPRIFPLSCLSSRKGRCKFSEGFIQPQVIPPFHGHQVAEPHVGQLMEDSDYAAFFAGIGSFRFIDIGITDSHTADILHSTRVIFGYEYLIILFIRVFYSPCAVIKIHAFGSDIKKIVYIPGCSIFQSLTAVYAHRHIPAAGQGMHSAPLGIRAGAYSCKVGGHDRGRFECPEADAVIIRSNFRRIRCGLV